MLNGLFKSGWQSKSVEKRIEWIQESTTDNAEAVSILESLVREDSDSSVRQAALGKITNLALTLEISQKHFDTGLRLLAETRFVELIGHNSSLDEEYCRAFIKKHPETTLSFIKASPHTKLRNEFLLKLPDSDRVEMIADIEYSDTRSFIAEKITSPELLEKARKSLKGKDKSAEKIIKTKLDEIHLKEKLEKENLEIAERLCDGMEYLASHTEWRPEFKDQYLVTKKRWDTLDFTPDDYLQQSYQKAFAKVSAGIAKRKRIKTVTQSLEKLANECEKECKETADSSLEELLESTSLLQASLKKWDSDWSTLSLEHEPETSVSKKYTQAHSTLSSVLAFCDSKSKTGNDAEPQKLEDSIRKLKTTIAKINWPDVYPPLNAKTEVLSELSGLQSKLNQTRKDSKEKLDKLHKKINRLLGSTKRGELNRAKRELAAIIKASNQYTGKDKLALDERLELATEAVDKMADWKDFATEPKYLELCEAMEALELSKTHPDKLSVEIGKLQKRWKALGHSESADQHWERFKAAGDKAYKPCDVFFKQRHEKRLKNLELREIQVAKAHALLNETAWDEQPDFKQIETNLRNISNAYQNIKDVEQGKGRKQWNKFKKIKDAIYAKLNIEYEANIELKNELITNASSLLEAEISDDSFLKLQNLQKKWKDIGVTRRKDDNLAWKKFKKVTDGIYEKIQNARQSKRAVEDEFINGYRNINRAIHSLAKSAHDLAGADSNFERLLSEYKVLDPLPRGLPEKLVDGIALDHKKACEAFTRERESIIQKSIANDQNNLAKKASLCTKLEALAGGGDDEAIESLKNEITAIPMGDNELRKRFEQRVKSAMDTDRSEATEIRQLMCIDLEILQGVESPDEDKSRRMQIQLERMQKGGFGQERIDKQAAVKKLTIDWYCLPGAKPEIQKKLDARFSKLIKSQD